MNSAPPPSVPGSAPAETPTPHQKALRLNFDKAVYGTFAEIGAGQEVARWFFRVGGAAGTVAKTMSAYDMVVSDAIYGEAKRYVSRERLEAMLDHEYGLLLERLGPTRGAETRFFVFADTVATCRYGSADPGHGWLGVRFQVAPLDEPSEVLVHVVLHDREREREQEALGIVGVNLVHGGVYQHDAPLSLMLALLDDLAPGRVEIDMIRFSGPAFASVDNRLMSLQLVERGLTAATMFLADGEVVQPTDALYRKPILIERGRFRPVTLLTLDMLHCAQARMIADHELARKPPLVLMEMTLRDLRLGASIDPQDFLARVDALRLLGHPVLISSHGPYYLLVEHLSKVTQEPIGIALGIPALQAILDERFYDTLSGRLLEAIGRLFAKNVRMYLHPHRDARTGKRIDAHSLEVPPHARHLYRHLLDNHHIVPIESCRDEYLSIDPRDVLRMIQSGERGWERVVPAEVVEVIRRERLFGCPPG